MSQWEANPQLDYSATGDDIDTASQKIIQMFNDVYEKLNRLRTMDASASHSVGDAEPFSFKIDTSVNPPALLCRNAAGTGYIQVGLIAENFGINAEALNLIASDGNIGSIKLGQEANLPANARTYDLYFAYDTGRLYMFLTGAWRVFLSLRFEDLLGVGNAVIEREEVAANGADKIPRLNEVGQGEFDITGSAAKIGGKNLYLPEIPDGCVLVFNATRDRWEVAARDDITQDDVSTTGEPNKIVKADANGAIANDTKGNAAKIATKTIDVSNLQDGDVLVYDATTGTFKNKQGAVVNAQGVVEANVSGSAQKWAGKAIQTVNLTDGQILVWSEALNAFINRNQSAVGNARALSLRQDGVELANYNGDEYRAVNIITPHLRVAGQAYIAGQTCFSKNMASTLYLECVTPGVTAGVEPDFSTAAIGDVVADGGAEWKVCGYVNSEVTDALNTRLAREEAITAHDYRQPNTTYAVGDIAYHASLPTGWYLECTTPGTTGSGDLAISGTITPNVTVVTDGTVVWTVCTVKVAAQFNHMAQIYTSGTYTAPVSGWYKITIKGGGAGGAGGVSNNSHGWSGNGGGEGGTRIAYVKMSAGDSASVIIGAGGAGGQYTYPALPTTMKLGEPGGNSSVTVDGITYSADGGQPLYGGNGTIKGTPGGMGMETDVNTSLGGGNGGGNGGGFSTPSAKNGTQGGGGAGGFALISITDPDSYTNGVGGSGGNGYVWFEYSDASL